MGRPEIGVSIDISSMVAAFERIAHSVEANVINTLDDCAALVQTSARAGHPKVADRIQGAEALPFRQHTPASAGEFSGMYRYLTRTGNLTTGTQVEPAKKVDGGYASGVVNGMEYSDKIEWGGFPFMRPALETNRQEITRRVGAAVRRGLGG